MFLADFSNSTPNGLPCTTEALRSDQATMNKAETQSQVRTHSPATPLLYSLERCIIVKDVCLNTNPNSCMMVHCLMSAAQDTSFLQSMSTASTALLWFSSKCIHCEKYAEVEFPPCLWRAPLTKLACHTSTSWLAWACKLQCACKPLKGKQRERCRTGAHLHSFGGHGLAGDGYDEAVAVRVGRADQHDGLALLGLPHCRHVAQEHAQLHQRQRVRQDGLHGCTPCQIIQRAFQKTAERQQLLDCVHSG